VHASRISRIRFAATVILLVCSVITSHADEGWTFVRGPEFDGHSAETDLMNSWPPDGPPVLWTRNLGQGYSAFVASGDRVFTQAQYMTGQYVYCLAADTGTTIWEYRYDWPYETAGVYPGPRSTPTVYAGRVYFTSPDGLLGCLDEKHGTLIWSVDLLDVYGIEGCDFGYACSPTLIDDMVILL
jgi:PQQ-like domain